MPSYEPGGFLEQCRASLTDNKISMPQFPEQHRTKPQPGLDLKPALLFTNRRNSDKPHSVCCQLSTKGNGLECEFQRIIVEMQREHSSRILACCGVSAAVTRSRAGCPSLPHPSGLHSDICRSWAISHNLLFVEASYVLILDITRPARSCSEFLLLAGLCSHH